MQLQVAGWGGTSQKQDSLKDNESRKYRCNRNERGENTGGCTAPVTAQRIASAAKESRTTPPRRTKTAYRAMSERP